eukprot:330583-Pelagomonas_calceolata.AAC.1
MAVLWHMSQRRVRYKLRFRTPSQVAAELKERLNVASLGVGWALELHQLSALLALLPVILFWRYATRIWKQASAAYGGYTWFNASTFSWASVTVDYELILLSA